MYDLNLAWGAGGNGAAVAAQSRGARGFTDADVNALHETHRRGVADRGWGRAQFVVNDFSQYLAIWDADAAEGAAPGLSIIRFAKTGTYALLIDAQFVANGKTLEQVLPALAVAQPKAHIAVAEHDDA
jgi:hypothetical protein